MNIRKSDNSWELSSFNELKGSSSSCGDMGNYLVGAFNWIDEIDGVSSPNYWNHLFSFSLLNNRVEDWKASFSEFFLFKYSLRTIPKHSFCSFKHFIELLSCIFSNIKSKISVLNSLSLISSNNCSRAIKLVAADKVWRNVNSDSLFFGFLDDSWD